MNNYFTNTEIEIIPDTKPKTVPVPVKEPEPSEWNFPAPSVEPSPKA